MEKIKKKLFRTTLKTFTNIKPQKVKKIFNKCEIEFIQKQRFYMYIKKFLQKYTERLLRQIRQIIFSLKKKKKNKIANNILVRKHLIYIRCIKKLRKKKKFFKIFFKKPGGSIVLQQFFFQEYTKLVNRALRKKTPIPSKFLLPELWIKNKGNKLNQNKSIGLSKELISLGAFLGNYTSWTNISQTPYFIGYKNFYSFYDLQTSIIFLKRAITFLKKVLSTANRTKFIFVGNPDNYDDIYMQLFHEIRKKFFSNENWEPGFFSENSRYLSYTYILIIYDITTNKLAYNEAVNRNIPVIAFLTPICEVSSVDYPILLNLKNGPLWFGHFCRAFLTGVKRKKSLPK